MASHLLLLLLLAFQPFALGISNKMRQDSYLSAYMDIQSTTDQPVGVVYPEPMRTYGPPQPKPMVYYGPPSGPPAPPIEYHHNTYAPMLDILMQLPSKLEFLPKLITAFLGVTKILLKVVLLKLVLKFVVMFCLFFFLPKLEMLDTATDMNTKPSMAPATNSTSAASANDEEEEEARLNRMTTFVLESVQNRPFLQKYCNSNEEKLKCKVLRMLTKLEEYVSIPRLIETMKSSQYQAR